MKIPGQRIKERRKERGWNQTELAEKVGVSRQQIMRYEVHGIQTMRARTLAALCMALGCSADWLLGIDGSGES